MNKPTRIQAATPSATDANGSSPLLGTGASKAERYSYRTTDCEECRGRGNVGGYARVAGEAYDCEPVEWPCAECDGSGEIDAACAECCRVLPLDSEGFCEECHDASAMPLADYLAKHKPHLLGVHLHRVVISNAQVKL